MSPHSPADESLSDESCVKSPAAAVEPARLRPSTNEAFPWLSSDVYAPHTPPARSRSPSQPPPRRPSQRRPLRRAASQRSTRSGGRESIVDLHLIVCDLDYYAGAVHDYQLAEEEAHDDDHDDHELEDDDPDRAWDEERGKAVQSPDARCPGFGQIQIIRTASRSMGRNGTVKRTPSRTSGVAEKDANLVTWEGPDDPANPQNWSRRARWMATISVSLFTFISPVSSSMVAPALGQIQREFSVSDPLQVQLALSVFILGFALGPLLLSPLSELFGRRIVLQLGNVFYLVFNLAAGFSTSLGLLIAFRFLSGVGGSAPLGIGGAVLADLWPPAERGRAMALYSLAPLLGPAIGPVAGGFIAQYSDWRWVFWSTSVAAAIVQLLGFFFLHETYAAALLTRKRRSLVRSTGNSSLYTEFDHPSRSLANHLSLAFRRPFILLLTQPIVQVLALYVAYVYGVLYLVLASFPLVWRGVYSFGPAITGLMYLSLGLGFFLGTNASARFADRVYRSLRSRNNDIPRPEFRVPLMFPGALLVPLGLLLYGWSAHYAVPWPLPCLGTALFAAGNQLVFQNCQTYLVDAYTRYAASAIAATAVFRSLAGFAFPLFAPRLYASLGYGWGNSSLALVGVIIGWPAPFLLWWCGPRLRAWSRFAAG